jgi:hypothetical protein
VSAPAPLAPSPTPSLGTRTILRTVLVVVGVVLSLYLIYLLRKPLTWIFIAGFLAIALSGPVSGPGGCGAASPSRSSTSR